MSDQPIGALTDRVLLKREDGTPIATIWARVRPQRATGDTHIVVVRFRSDVNPGDRFMFRGRRLDVTKTEDLNGRRAFLSCMCRAATLTALEAHP